ncbi:MAG: aldehyde dehydrogenase family protein [Acidimicrobiales bacterium]
MGEVRTWGRLYIGGEWVAPAATGSIEVVNPATEAVCATVPAGGPDDVARAAAAARAALPAWSATPPRDRAAAVARLGEAVQGRMAELGQVITEELGMPVNLATMIQVGLPVMTLSAWPSIVDSFTFEERVGNSLVVREAAGVIAAITPWNYPLHQIAAKVGPALVAGCTVVLKPSELVTSVAFLLAGLAQEAGLPPGLLNVVSGAGDTGRSLVESGEVDMVSFTGSTAVGRQVAARAAGTVKRVALELGGKSPNVILDDADLAHAVTAGITSAFLNSGQTCSALSRMLVPRSRLAEAEELASERAAHYVPGDPFAPGTRLGPVVSSRQRDRVQGYIRSGLEEGARLVAGGPERPEGLDRGWYVRPTVLSGVQPWMRVAREEIFGPVLAILAYDTEEQAVELANDSEYGLHAAVWSADQERALAVARRLQAGMVEVNGGMMNPLAPWGGCKQSGNGRELGRYGLEEFVQLKSLQL